MTATLYDPQAPTARLSDPTTSSDYGRGDPTRNRQCAAVLCVIAAANLSGATCAEIVATLRTDRGITARRITDLHHIGLIDRNGDTRTFNGSRRQLVNRITPAGEALIPAARRLLLEEVA